MESLAGCGVGREEAAGEGENRAGAAESKQAERRIISQQPPELHILNMLFIWIPTTVADRKDHVCSLRSALSRQNQAAEENHRQRLLRRCLTEWRLCCRMEKKQREISSKQQEMQRKVAALLDAVSAAKAKAADAANNESADAPPELPNQPESSDKVRGSPSPCLIFAHETRAFCQIMQQNRKF